MERDQTIPGSPPVWLLWSLPIVGVLIVVPLWWLWKPGYWAIVGEDRAAEWLTFLAYAAVCALSVLAAVRLSRHGSRADTVLYSLLALAALFVAGEEVSWFQRQLGFAGPEKLVALNKQDEANLHNLLGRVALETTYLLVALYGSLLGRWLVPRLPILRVRPWLYAPPPSLAAWFGCAWVYYGWAVYLNPLLRRIFGPSVDIVYLTGPDLQEVVELALAGGFLLFVARVIYHGVGSGPPQPTASAEPVTHQTRSTPVPP